MLSCLFLLFPGGRCLAGSGDVPWEGEVAIVVSNDFATGLPAGWSVVVNADSNACWQFDHPDGWGNLTGGAGGFAGIYSFGAGYVDGDTELRSPSYAVMHTALTYLVFRTDFRRYELPPEEIADVDISTNGFGGDWQNLWRQTGASFRGQVCLDLTQRLMGASNFMVRFHYYNSNCDWWWQVDDVWVAVEGDVNANGLPDWWESRYYGGPTNLVATCDSDQDGASDVDEFTAGTDPTNRLSVLRLQSFQHSPGQDAFQFQTISGRVYGLMMSTNILTGYWTSALPGFTGRGGATNLTLSEGVSERIYRISAARW